MTYCVGLLLDQGLVMLADTRTNGGVDNISCFAKLHRFDIPGERNIALMTSGNLAVSQSVLHLIQEGLPDPETGAVRTIANVPTLFAAANLIGDAVQWAFKRHGEAMRQHEVPFDVSFLLGGQIAGRALRLFQIYAASNFIEASADTPFLQIGEHKYGKPILDRAISSGTTLAEATKLALISMDSTLRSNLSVGLPLDLLILTRDRMDGGYYRRIDETDAYFAEIRKRWSTSLREAISNLPDAPWAV